MPSPLSPDVIAMFGMVVSLGLTFATAMMTNKNAATRDAYEATKHSLDTTKAALNVLTEQVECLRAESDEKDKRIERLEARLNEKDERIFLLEKRITESERENTALKRGGGGKDQRW